MAKPSPLHDFLDLVIVLITSVGAFLGAAVMAVLFLVGLVEIGLGAIDFLKGALWADHNTISYGLKVTRVIHGVELLLLAPVPFLIFDSLNNYLPRVKIDGEENLARAEELCAKKRDEAHSDVLRVKGFVIGLLFALLATTSIGNALSGNLTLQNAASVGIIMSILGIFFIALERVAVARRAG